MQVNLILTLTLTFLHLSIGKWHWLQRIPQRRWLSFGGGVAIAYVFIKILPSLSQAETILNKAIAVSVMNRVYLLALTGLIVFYGLEILAQTQQLQSKPESWKKSKINASFWLHIAFAAIFNALFSYLLNHTARTIDCLLLFVAVAFQYAISDRNLRSQHPQAYDKIGRWILSGAILGGWMLRFVMPVGEIGITLVKSFLAGGLILKVLQREIPKEQESCFWSFVWGAGFFTILLLLV